MISRWDYSIFRDALGCAWIETPYGCIGPFFNRREAAIPAMYIFINDLYICGAAEGV
jgi:hypothetical protein